MSVILSDRRRSLWDLDIHSPIIGNYTYHLEAAPERGGGSLVYHATKKIRIGNQIHEQKVLLKEFYPLLNPDVGAGITRRADGTLQIPEATAISIEYKDALQRFQQSVGAILELGKSDLGVETTVVPLNFMEAYGTWYFEQAYDSGTSLAEILSWEEGDYPGEVRYDFGDFLNIYKKCIETVNKLHLLGYYHLDFTPWNVSYTTAENIKLFDADSFVKKDELEKVTILRRTEGFSAPELEAVIYQPWNTSALIGPWTDVYSLTQFLCWYLYGHPLEEEDLEEALEQLEDKIRKTYREDSDICFSKQGVEDLKQFLRKNLNPKKNKRAGSMTSMLLDIHRMERQLFLREESTAPMLPVREKWSWKKLLLWDACGFGLISAGSIMLQKANEMVGPMTSYNPQLGKEVFSIGIMFQGGPMVHLLGEALWIWGIVMILCSIYQMVTPYGWRFFIKEYSLTILGGAMASFALTMPGYFAYSSRIYSDWEGLAMCQKLLMGGVMMGSLVVLLYWTWQILLPRFRKGFLLEILTILLAILALAYAYVQCISIPAELLLFGIFALIVFVVQEALKRR